MTSSLFGRLVRSTVSFGAGAFAWTLAEHVIHDKLGHKYAKNGNPFAKEHVRHHATTSYFAPPSKKVFAAATAGAAITPAATALLGRSAGRSFTAGFLLMYGTYEVVHRRAHTHPPTHRYGRWLRRHHFYHHFHKPKKNHGVTVPWWDHVFGTHEVPGKIRVPRRHAMPWLVDPDTGEVWSDFADDYELRGPKPAHKETSDPLVSDIGATDNGDGANVSCDLGAHADRVSEGVPLAAVASDAGTLDAGFATTAAP
ncbi:MAG: sterol desaturase family protein [Myxococcota bacterium]